MACPNAGGLGLEEVPQVGASHGSTSTAKLPWNVCQTACQGDSNGFAHRRISGMVEAASTEELTLEAAALREIHYLPEQTP
jgi:hypothetical protein